MRRGCAFGCFGIVTLRCHCDRRADVCRIGRVRQREATVEAIWTLDDDASIAIRAVLSALR
jgi:hypothetical protein